MTDANAFLMLEIRKFEGQCLNARTAVARARDLRELKRAADVSAPPVIRAVIHTLADYRALQAETDERARTLVKTAVERLRRLSVDERDAAVGAFRRDVLEQLRGDFAHLYGWAERELRLATRPPQS